MFQRAACGPAGTLRPWARGRVCPPASGFGAPPALLYREPPSRIISFPSRVSVNENRPACGLRGRGDTGRSQRLVGLRASSGARHAPPALLVPVPPLPALPAETADPPADAESHDAAPPRHHRARRSHAGFGQGGRRSGVEGGMGVRLHRRFVLRVQSSGKQKGAASSIRRSTSGCSVVRGPACAGRIGTRLPGRGV